MDDFEFKLQWGRCGSKSKQSSITISLKIQLTHWKLIWTFKKLFTLNVNVTGKETNREILYSLDGLFSRWRGAKSLNQASHLVSVAANSWAILHCFTQLFSFSQSWIRTGATGIRTSAHIDVNSANYYLNYWIKAKISLLCMISLLLKSSKY